MLKKILSRFVFFLVAMHFIGGKIPLQLIKFSDATLKIALMTDMECKEEGDSEESNEESGLKKTDFFSEIAFTYTAYRRNHVLDKLYIEKYGKLMPFPLIDIPYPPPDSMIFS